MVLLKLKCIVNCQDFVRTQTFVDLHIAFLLVLSAIITMLILYLLYPHGLYSLLEF